APDHQLVHGLGALVGDHRFQVQGVADRGVLGGDAGAAEQVAAFAGDVDGHAAVVPLGQRDLLRLHRARVLQAAQLQHQQLGQGDAAGHVGQLDLRALGGGDRAAEQDALLAVVQRLVQAGDGGADRTPGDAVAGLGQAAQRTLEALDVGQAVGLGHAHVVEVQGAGHRGAQAHLVLDLLGGEAGRALLHDEALDALVGLRPDDGDVGQVAVGDPHLRAVEHPVAAILAGVGLHVGRVGAAVRLGQAEAADHLAGGHARQPLPPLLLRAVGVDRVHAQRGLHADEAAQAAVAALQLLADQAVADRVEAGAAVFLRQRGTEQAQRRDLRDQLLREAALVEALADDRQHPLVGEPGYRLLHGTLLFAEHGTHVVQVVGGKGHGGYRLGKWLRLYPPPPVRGQCAARQKRRPPPGERPSVLATGPRLLAVGALRADVHAGGDDLAVDHRQAVGLRLLVQAQGAFLALVAVGHVVADHLVLGAQGDALAGLLVHALGAGGAVRVAEGHGVADHPAGLGGGVLGAALALGAADDLAADVALVDLVADHAAGHGAGRGGDLLALAAADLVADQATDDRAGHGAADVAVALGQALLHHHVLAHFMRD